MTNVSKCPKHDKKIHLIELNNVHSNALTKTNTTYVFVPILCFKIKNSDKSECFSYTIIALAHPAVIYIYIC